MSDILILSFLFAMGSLLGWCLEVVYRRFSPANKSRRWINPGFMTGPYLPIYGFGLIALYLIELERLIL
ncbi:MAG: putative ABC transporter permease [Anaerovoracaceae bacterium]